MFELRYLAPTQDEPMEEEGNQKTPLTKEIRLRISEAVTPNWRQLALKLGYNNDEVRVYCQSAIYYYEYIIFLLF